MTTCKTILTPTTKEPKICHALATTSAFNLKLCPMSRFILPLAGEDQIKLFNFCFMCKLRKKLRNAEKGIGPNFAWSNEASSM